MAADIRHNLRVTGTTNATGGVYEQVKITGEATIDGNIDCIGLRCVGTSEINGNLKAQSVRLVGTARITGNLESDKIWMQGQADIDGQAAVKNANIHGMFSTKGNLTGEKLRVGGYLKVDGDCEAEIFRVRGAFTIGGLLNAGDMEIRLWGGCEAKEVGGEKIVVKKSNSIQLIFKQIFFSGIASRLCAHVIEGDEIYLEHTEAKIVRGNNVVLGPGCEIEQVEYQNEFQQHKKAIVRKSKKI